MGDRTSGAGNGIVGSHYHSGMCRSPLCRLIWPIVLALLVLSWLMRPEWSTVVLIAFVGGVVMFMARTRGFSA
jgi:hypothetical protein